MSAPRSKANEGIFLDGLVKKVGSHAFFAHAILKHRQFRFERFGHTNHLKIETFEDLEAVLALDKAHWTAAAPAQTTHCGPVFPDLMDADSVAAAGCAG